MILYLSIIFVVATLIAIFNIIFTSTSWYIIVGIVAGATCFQILVDGLFALIVNNLPDKWFAMDKKCFKVSKKSQRLYEKLQIRKWKDKVLELGILGGFRKNKINDPNSPEYVEKFIVESNKGIVIHRIGYFVGFLVMLVFPFKFAFSIGLPVAITNMFLNILPVMILRYNIPKLMTLHKRLTRMQDNTNLKKEEE